MVQEANLRYEIYNWIVLNPQANAKIEIHSWFALIICNMYWEELHFCLFAKE